MKKSQSAVYSNIQKSALKSLIDIKADLIWIILIKFHYLLSSRSKKPPEYVC